MRPHRTRPRAGNTATRAVGAVLAALCVWAALPAVASAQAQPKPSKGHKGSHSAQMICDASYLPTRSTWRRTVDLQYDSQRVTTVAIDGVPVYSFQVNGTTIFTALDGERIQIDTGTLHWSSRFREAATSQGRCEWSGQ